MDPLAAPAAKPINVYEMASDMTRRAQRYAALNKHSSAAVTVARAALSDFPGDEGVYMALGVLQAAAPRYEALVAARDENGPQTGS